MKVFKAPMIKMTYDSRYKLFLAGGISNCPNWQDDMVEMFKNHKEKYKQLTIFNPRRRGDLAKDTDVAKQQIVWEHVHLLESTHILFWFPEETVCPITLFELGKYAAKFTSGFQRLFVGIHPNYSRKFDLEIQLPLISPAIKIVYSLEELYNQVSERITN
jgi:hypothetical protein